MAEYLPEEVIEQILLWLPLQALVKCTIVSKSWRSLITSSDFAASHLRRTVKTNHRNGHHLRLLRSSDAEQSRSFFSLHWESPEFCEYTKLESPFRFICNDEYLRNNIDNWALIKEKANPLIDVVGTCNGLVCLADFLCLIWNPSVRKYVILPRETTTNKDMSRVIKSFGFGYDPRSNDYKVLRLLSDGFREVEVYSLATGTWRSLGGIPLDFMPYRTSCSLEHRHVSVNGALHWLDQRRCKSQDNAVVCFDLGEEEFSEMAVPEELKRELCYVSKYKEWLALIRCKLIGQEPTSSGFYMWVMNEYGVADSWTMLFSVRLQGFTYEPVSLTTNGEVVLKRDMGEGPLWVDLKRMYATAFGTKGYKYHFLDYFVESIVLLGQSNAVSY